MLLRKNWDQIINSFPENKKNSLIIVLNWLIELIDAEPQITQEIRFFYQQTLQSERIFISRVVSKYNLRLKQAVSKFKKFKNFKTHENFLHLLKEIQEIDQSIKSILQNNEFYDPAELYALVIYEINTFETEIEGFLYDFFIKAETEKETNSLFINLFFEYIFLNLDIGKLSKLLVGNVIATRKFLSFIESEIFRKSFQDDLSEKLKICFIHIFEQTQITGVQLKILEASFWCYKNGKINEEDYNYFLNRAKKKCDTNNLVRFANMTYLSEHNSSMYLSISNEFIELINSYFGGISRPSFGES